MPAHETNLRVGLIYERDIYRDMVRLHRDNRGGIKEGTIAKISVGNRRKIVVVRGTGNSLRTYILMDELTRDQLGIENDEIYRFRLASVGWIGQVLWAYRAADAAARIAAMIAIWSAVLGIVLGLIGLALGVWPLLK